MRPRFIALLISASLAFAGRIAHAGSVQIKLFDGHKFDDWVFGTIGPPTLPGSVASCGTAKFGKCSDCAGLLVQNSSQGPLKISTEITGSGFGSECLPGVVAVMRCPSGKRLTWTNGMKDCGTIVQPGESCVLPPVEFCPQRAGTVRGAMRVSMIDGSRSKVVMQFPLEGTGDLPPYLARASRVLQRHNAELMKIRHVSVVELDNRNDDIAIDVEVAEGYPLEPVRRAVPPKIGGYRTEVTRYDPVGCGL